MSQAITAVVHSRQDGKHRPALAVTDGKLLSEWNPEEAGEKHLDDEQQLGMILVLDEEQFVDGRSESERYPKLAKDMRSDGVLRLERNLKLAKEIESDEWLQSVLILAEELPTGSGQQPEWNPSLVQDVLQALKSEHRTTLRNSKSRTSSRVHDTKDITCYISSKIRDCTKRTSRLVGKSESVEVELPYNQDEKSFVERNLASFYPNIMNIQHIWPHNDRVSTFHLPIAVSTVSVDTETGNINLSMKTRAASKETDEIPTEDKELTTKYVHMKSEIVEVPDETPSKLNAYSGSALEMVDLREKMYVLDETAVQGRSREFLCANACDEMKFQSSSFLKVDPATHHKWECLCDDQEEQMRFKRSKNETNGKKSSETQKDDGIDHFTRKAKCLDRTKCLEKMLPRRCSEHSKIPCDYVRFLRELTWLPFDQRPIPQTNITVGVISEPLDDVLKNMANGQQPSPRITMQYELLRMCTLRNYPRDDKPYIIRLAEAGFYYASDGDEVVCYVCGLRKRNWHQSDVPMDVHRRISPDCRFLTHNSDVNVPVPRSSSPDRKFAFLNDLDTEPVSYTASATNSSQDVMVPTASASSASNTVMSNSSASSSNGQRQTARPVLDDPRYPQHAIRSRRLSSFVNWPDSTGQNPETLADAGFYYADIGDCIRCFYCGIGLRHWTAEDDVWIEHARWSRNCKYLLQVKGEEYVQLVHLAIQYTQDEEEQPVATNGTSGNTPPSEEIDLILRSNAAQSVLEMGHQPRIIKKAIERVLRDNGASGITAQMIMEKVLEIEEENEAANTTQTHVSPPNQNRGASRHLADDITNGQALAQLDISRGSPSVDNMTLSHMPINRQTPSTSGNSDVHNTISTNSTSTANDVMNTPLSTTGELPEGISSGTSNSSTTTRASIPNASTNGITTAVSFSSSSLPSMAKTAIQTATLAMASSNIPKSSFSSLSTGGKDVPQTNIQAAVVAAVSGNSFPPGATSKPVDSPERKVIINSAVHNSETEKTKLQNGEEGQTSLEMQKSADVNEEGQSDTRSPKRSQFPTRKVKALREENEKLKGQATCKVCMDKLVSVVFLPCGHLVTCTDCAPAMRKCPVCRALIKGTVKTYMG